jgi:hypothetical protein
LLTLVVVLAVAAVLFAPWGPGTHLEYSDRIWRRRREVLPADKATLIGQERRAFAYGSLAADLINFKTFGGHYNHCHRWTIVDEMLDLSSSAQEEAFAFGYLTHLAADTIAHNHFVPYHLARYSRNRGLGHLYWEVTADRFVPDERWREMGGLKNDPSLDTLDELVHRTVERKALPRLANKVIFNHVLLSGERDTWRQRIAKLQPIAQVRLDEGFLDSFRSAALERAVLALQPRGVDRLAHVDTNGHAALEAATELARQARGGILRRRPMPSDDEIERTAAGFLTGMETPPEAGGAPLWLPGASRAS